MCRRGIIKSRNMRWGQSEESRCQHRQSRRHLSIISYAADIRNLLSTTLYSLHSIYPLSLFYDLVLPDTSSSINTFRLKFFEMPAAIALHLLRIPVNTLHCLKSSQHSPGIFRWTSENFSISCSTAHNFNTENWNRTCRNCCKTVSGYSDLIILWSPSS